MSWFSPGKCVFRRVNNLGGLYKGRKKKGTARVPDVEYAQMVLMSFILVFFVIA
jgi:hypothetical protein